MIEAVSEIAWQPCYRLIPSRFPPVGLFDRVASPEDLQAVFAIEAMTNPRLRQEAGEISLVAPQDRIIGPGTTPIMAAFTHLNPEGSRFSDGSWGVYYAGRSLDTAIAETRYHREQFLGRTNEAAIEIDMRCYFADLRGVLHDIRGRRDLPDIYDPASYGASQTLGRELKTAASNGIVYDSVRDSGGECVGVLRPPLLCNCVQGPHFGYVWDGHSIVTIYEKKLVRNYPGA